MCFPDDGKTCYSMKMIENRSRPIIILRECFLPPRFSAQGRPLCFTIKNELVNWITSCEYTKLINQLLGVYKKNPSTPDNTRQPLGRTVCWLKNPRPAPFPLQQSATRPGHLKSPCQPEQFVEFCLEMASMVESVSRNQH